MCSGSNLVKEEERKTDKKGEGRETSGISENRIESRPGQGKRY